MGAHKGNHDHKNNSTNSHDTSQQSQRSHKSSSSSRGVDRLGSTTSLGKRRRRRRSGQQQQSSAGGSSSPAAKSASASASGSLNEASVSMGSDAKGAEYGSQAATIRVPSKPGDLTKVAILGAAGGIGQPLALLLMLHCEYVQHVALHDLANFVHGVGADLSHVDRQCRITSHLGPDELAEAVRGAKVIIVPAGLAQKPGMSRDDLFGSNAKIMMHLAKVCAQVAPNAMLAIITNPVNSLVPLACEVYQRTLAGADKREASPARQPAEQHQAGAAKQGSDGTRPGPAQAEQHKGMHDCCRRIFGVTTLDVVRASSLTARSALFKPEPSGLFKDPSKISVPVVGGHAGKTIIPLLSSASPKLDKKRLLEDKATRSTLVESVQQAGIEVLNQKKGKGSATLAMAYAACRFTISLLRAQMGEPNIVECAYVRLAQQPLAELDYFAGPLLLGRDGYVKSLLAGPMERLLPFEKDMLEEGARELRLSIAKGEDFAREHYCDEDK